MKSKRVFLENTKASDSYITVNVFEGGSTELKMADCDRRIYWQFGMPGSRRAKAKIAKVKAVIDEVYNYLHEIKN